jgi:hypothetical protein
MYAATQ